MTITQLSAPSVMDTPMPSNRDAERVVLGSVLINSGAYYRVITIVQERSFYSDDHRKIFAAMTRLAESNRPIEPFLLREELSRTGDLQNAGGLTYLSSLLDVVPDVANVEYYAELVKEKAALRQLIIAGNKVMRAAGDVSADSTGVLSIAEASLQEIASNSVTRGLVRIADTQRVAIASLEQMRGGNAVTGLSTGFGAWDERTAGLHPSQLIILAARPAMGKTTLACNVAQAVAIPRRNDEESRAATRNVALFSLEMSTEEINLRVLCAESRVSNNLVRSGLLSSANWDAFAKASSRIAKAKLWIDDSAAITPMELKAKARRLAGEVGGLDLVIVDYLQLMRLGRKSESRQQEVSEISRSLKEIAKELRVPVIPLAQLSRKPEQRAGDHRPQLSDLRESGAIEQDADVVLFIYRDEIYNRETEDRGIAEIIIAKQRNGPIGDFRLVYQPEFMQFYNLALGTEGMVSL